MRFRALRALVAVGLFGVLPLSPPLAAQSTTAEITTFDAPGAGTAAGFGTFAQSINDAGAITGHYSDANNVNHGFLRSPLNGNFIRFDAPGAGTAATFGTFPRSINSGGAITGNYIDADNVSHGFLRAPRGGRVTSFDVPAAGTAAGSGFGTFPVGINAAGAITGHYTDASNVNHGFLRGPHGEIIMFDVPGADMAEGSGNGTFPESISDAGAITGHYIGRSALGIVNHGFLRGPQGDIVTFDVPDASSAPGDGTFPRGINANGAIVGNYSVADQEVNRGFLRGLDGSFTTFQAPGADTAEGSGNGTFPESINGAGAITGHYTGRSASGIVNHGFLRSPQGEVVTFDAPGVSSASGDGTFPRSINANGAIVGNYSAADEEVNRGFLRAP